VGDLRDARHQQADDAGGQRPYVLACAALLSDLATAIAVLASVAPYPSDGLDWFTGIGEDNGSDFRFALTDPTRPAPGWRSSRSRDLLPPLVR
jgi:hypothetical protein